MIQRTVCCLICESTYDEGDQCAIEGKHSGALYGVCPTCRRHANIGKRIEEMEECECGLNGCGWNNCLRQAKGGAS